MPLNSFFAPLVLLYLLATLVSSPASAVAAETSQAVTTPPKQERFFDKVAPVPALFFTPETGWGGGLGIAHSYRNSNDPDDVKDSTLIPLALFTEKKQTVLRLFSRNFIDQGLYYSDLAVGFTNYPSRYFGIGDRTRLEDQESFNERFYALSWELLRRVFDSRSLYAGMTLRYDQYEILDADPDGLLKNGQAIGAEYGLLKGIGFRVMHNNRNHVFTPNQGGRHEFLYVRYAPQWGSDFNFTDTLLRLRHYWAINRSSVFAGEISIEEKNGDVPFRQLAMLGGQFRNRGLYMGRYRDRSAAILQVDYRTWFTPKWGAVASASGGWVAPTLNKLPESRTHFTYGFGGRYMILPKKGMDFRLDYARARDQKAYYFGVGEAF